MEQLPTFIGNHWELFLALAVIVLMLLSGNFISVLRGIKQIGPAEATRLINHENALVIDIRENKEFTDGHIINSRHIPMNTVQQHISKLASHKNKPVIVSCRTGARSSTVCGWLRKHGFENVSSLKGGIMAWQSANLPLSKG